MTRRLEAGPLLVAIGAAVLIVSLFLTWFDGTLTAWRAFEAWDVVLAALGIAALACTLGELVPDLTRMHRRWLAPISAAALVIVISQLLDPPPAALGNDIDTGGWLALAAVVAMCAGTVLTFSRVHLSVSVEERAPVRVPAVDARRDDEEDEADATPPDPAVAPPTQRGDRLFSRRQHRGPDPDGPDDPSTPRGERSARVDPRTEID
jgi:hypothetical protein